MSFSQCKSINDVLKRLNNVIEARKRPVGDDYCLVGIGDYGAEFITFLDRPTGFKKQNGFKRLLVYKLCEVIDE